MIAKVMIPIIFSTMLLCGSALADEHKEPKLDDVNVVNTPTVVVANGPTEPIPVSVVAPPQTSVMCYRSLGGGGGGGPFSSGQTSFAQTNIVCPVGVEMIDVQRVTFSPDIGGSGTISNVANYRLTVSFTGTLGAENLAGFIAILTDGAPEAVVAQHFRIDTMDNTSFINAKHRATSGIDTRFVFFTGTLYFIGTPVP
jgi:hypothetical protein